MKRRKFMYTAGGMHICLLPQNYNILSRATSYDQWKIDIDPAVPKDLAMLIFGEYHTEHEVRWGTADYVTKRLNELL